MIYLIGSLRCPTVPEVAFRLRAEGFDVFDDWYSPGPEADDHWQAYERARGRTYKEALAGYHAKDVFDFDREHLQRADTGVLIMPAGKSAHLELGWVLGKGKRGYVLFDKEPERYDIMYQFANAVCFSIEELLEELNDDRQYRSKSSLRREKGEPGTCATRLDHPRGARYAERC